MAIFVSAFAIPIPSVAVGATDLSVWTSAVANVVLPSNPGAAKLIYRFVISISSISIKHICRVGSSAITIEHSAVISVTINVYCVIPISSIAADFSCSLGSSASSKPNYLSEPDYHHFDYRYHYYDHQS